MSQYTIDLGAAEDWELLGEGGANAVFGYRGDEDVMNGLVLRIKKKVRVKEGWKVRDLEDLVWEPIQGMVGADTLQREAAFFNSVMSPLLGPEYVEAVTIQSIPSEFAAELLFHNQGKLRSYKEAMEDLQLHNIGELEVMVMKDMTKLPPGTSLDDGPTICVELKPKCGFVLEECATIHPAHRIKQRCMRFHLQQGVKLAGEQVDRISSYSPLELFSGDTERITEALRVMVEEPQNNFRVFSQGQKVYCAPMPSEDVGMRPLGRRLRDAGFGKPVAGKPDEDASDLLLRMLTCVLQKESDVMKGLLRAQKLETVDVEGVHEVYKYVIKHHLQPKAEEKAEVALEHQQEGLPESKSLDLRSSGPCRPDCSSVKSGAHAGESSSSDHQAPQGTAGTLPFVATARLLMRMKGMSPARKINTDPLAKMLTCGCESEPHYHTEDGKCSLGIECNDPSEINEHLEALAALRELPFSKKIDMLREYIIAKTAQDCSIMFAMQRCGSGADGTAVVDGESRVVQDPVTGTLYRYQVRFVDLDVKSLAKVPRHYQADLERVHAWHRMCRVLEEADDLEKVAAPIKSFVSHSLSGGERPISSFSSGRSGQSISSDDFEVARAASGASVSSGSRMKPF